jgi:glycosyltransferase involved in cell wall biosynthesis
LFYCIFHKEEDFILNNKQQVDVIIEQRFYQCSDGNYWTENSFPYSFWTRYLTVFDQVNIVARVKPVNIPNKDWHQVNGLRVCFFSLPYYIGLKGFISSLPALLSVLIKRRQFSRAIIYRVPSVLAFLYKTFATNQKTYGAEVVGDPSDTFSENASSSIFRRFIRTAFIHMLKAQCKSACAISYVTETSLQKSYPPASNAFHTHYSSIQLNDDDYQMKNTYTLNNKLKILCIGNLSQPYKGCDFMLNTIAELHSNGQDIELSWVGGGELLNDMKALAKSLNISKQVKFIGNLSERSEISAMLDSTDIFVLASRQEGLPRVVIEAMARSVVCIATNVGGVSELLDSEHVIERDNINQLSKKIVCFTQLNDEQRLEIAQRNYHKATQYQDRLLTERRIKMYQYLLDASK